MDGEAAGGGGGGGGDEGDGESGGGIGGPMTVGLSTKLKSVAGTPRLVASALGSDVSVLTVLVASELPTDPVFTTVTEASTLSSVLVVLISELEIPSSNATALASTVGAARDTLDDEFSV